LGTFYAKQDAHKIYGRMLGWTRDSADSSAAADAFWRQCQWGGQIYSLKSSDVGSTCWCACTTQL